MTIGTTMALGRADEVGSMEPIDLHDAQICFERGAMARA